jgi:hypothetical protein
MDKTLKDWQIKRVRKSPRIKIEIGETYHYLKILKEIKPNTTKGGITFECICKCGKITTITQYQILKSKKMSCGCFRKEIGSKRLYKGIGKSAISYIISSYRYGAFSRSLEFNLEQQDIFNIVTKPCYYCGEEKSMEYVHKNKNNEISNLTNFKHNGIDRLDSSKGYFLDNCVPCCKQCNIMKMNYSEESFLNKIKKIYEYKKLK